MSSARIHSALMLRHGQRIRHRATRLAEIAAEMHRNAPRGGRNLNRYGLRRSAPGEVPAIEEGTLLSFIEKPPTQPTKGRYRVVINRHHLEFGTRTIAPRPLGRRAMAKLRQEILQGDVL